MVSKLGLMAGILALTLSAGNSDAMLLKAPTGIVSVKSGHKAGNPATAQPSGNFTVSPATAAGDEYQVLVDFGQFVNGAFVPWAGGPTATQAVASVVGNFNYDWGPTGVMNLNNPPNFLQVRAQLQWKNGGAWITIATSYTPCP